MELEEYVDHLRDRVDAAVLASHGRREQLRAEILADHPDLGARIRRPPPGTMRWARHLLRTGTVS
ncbi:hypothetical protein [Nonomuraea sp. NPDC050783]|uniref:hypothetical protein n=1 Tax=Nonomuraea sp. NPDC050783 TaxID=3154634 RepID=UPI00346513AA